MTGASATVSRRPKPTDGNRRKHRYRDSPPVSACRDRRPLISLLLSAVHRSCPPASGFHWSSGVVAGPATCGDRFFVNRLDRQHQTRPLRQPQGHHSPENHRLR